MKKPSVIAGYFTLYVDLPRDTATNSALALAGKLVMAMKAMGHERVETIFESDATGRQWVEIGIIELRLGLEKTRLAAKRVATEHFANPRVKASVPSRDSVA